MSPMNNYWNRIARDNDHVRARDAGVEADFRRSARVGPARLQERFIEAYKKRVRGSKIRCMCCLEFKPKKDFREMRSGYVESQCRACQRGKRRKKTI